MIIFHFPSPGGNRLQNCVLDSGASHNVMPEVVMEALGLSITNSYKDVYALDPRAVSVVGMIRQFSGQIVYLPAKKYCHGCCGNLYPS